MRWEVAAVPEVVALLVSDLHLSHTPPLARSKEPDWYEAMARPLRELQDLQKEYRCVTLCGGDVFDRWGSPPKLINFAMKMLPASPLFSSVMGQHDLPYHDWEHRESSAFWTLVEAGTIAPAVGWLSSKRVAWRGFQWGEDIDMEKDRALWFRQLKMPVVCIAHRYVWAAESDAPAVLRSRESNVASLKGKIDDCDVVLFGDNHRGFLRRFRVLATKIVTVYNPGGFMRRTADDASRQPSIGLLLEDGSVRLHFLDTSKDVFDDSDSVREAESTMPNFDSFVQELRGLDVGELDFRRAVEAAMAREQVSQSVRKIVLEALETRD